MGRILFYLLWPLVWLFALLTIRGRAVVVVGKEVLVVKNWFGSGAWQLPGGGLKHSEEAMVAINREIHEELGYNLPAGRQLCDRPIFVQAQGLVLRQYYGLYILPSKPAMTTNKEITEYKWVSLEEAPLPEQVRQAVQKLMGAS